MKWFAGFIISMVILNFFVTDDTWRFWLNVIWIAFWLILFAVFAIFVYYPDWKHDKKMKKAQKGS